MNHKYLKIGLTIFMVGVLFLLGNPLFVSADVINVTQTSYGDFAQGCPSLSLNTTHVSDADGGAVELAANLADDFPGSSLNTTNWSSGLWVGGPYSPTINQSILTINSNEGAWVRSLNTFTHGIIETTAQFSAGAYQHIGFGDDGFAGSRYFLFSTFIGDGNLYARFNNSFPTGEIADNLGAIPSGYHRYRIEWSAVNGTTDQVSFYIDGTPVATRSFSSSGATNLYFYISNNGAGALRVDYAQATPTYLLSGIYTSCQFDAGVGEKWSTLSWDATLTSNNLLTVETRTSTDGITWTGWGSQTNGGHVATPDRWVQYRLNLATTNLNETPLVKSITRSFESVDLTISQSGTSNVDALGNITYTLSISNLSTNTANGLSVVDALPTGFVFGSAGGTGWTCGEVVGTVTCTRSTLASGAAPDITIQGTAPADGGILTNIATVSSDKPDIDTTNNSSSFQTTVVAIADLSITMTGSPDPIYPGQVITYQLKVNNAGPSTALSVIVTNTLPSGVSFVDATGSGWGCIESLGVVICSRSTLAVGAAPDITIHATAVQMWSHQLNTAVITGSSTDHTHSNDQTSISTNIAGKVFLPVIQK